MWKLIRHAFGNEEFTLREGKEETVGRGVENTITLSSIVISRRHCVIKVEKKPNPHHRSKEFQWCLCWTEENSTK